MIEENLSSLLDPYFVNKKVNDILYVSFDGTTLLYWTPSSNLPSLDSSCCCHYYYFCKISGSTAMMVLLSLSLVLGFMLQEASPQVLGTFTMVRESDGCTALTAEIVAPNASRTNSTSTTTEGCARASVADIVNNMAPTIRYMGSGGGEVEVAIGALTVLGSVTSTNLSYECPPDGYNGFSVADGSFCLVSPDTQLWATFTDYNTTNLRQIRVILSNSFPPVDSLEDNGPPFGTALYDFGDGLDLSTATGTSDELVLCPVTNDSAPECPLLPTSSGLNTRISVQASGYFGGSGVFEPIPGDWNQNDELQLLSGITSPSAAGGLQDFYFNASGFYVYGYASDIAPDFCMWFDYCPYSCEVYNYDARFFDDLGTWNVTWKVDQEEIDPVLSAGGTRIVQAYIGNAIDGVGIFPSIMYTNVGSTAYLGLDKVGSALVANQPSYTYYWYTNYTTGAPPMDVFTPPDLCFASAPSASAPSPPAAPSPPTAPSPSGPSPPGPSPTPPSGSPPTKTSRAVDRPHIYLPSLALLSTWTLLDLVVL